MQLLYRCLKCGVSRYAPESRKCPICLVLMVHTWTDTKRSQ